MSDLTIYGTMSLGSLIKALEAIPKRSPCADNDQRARVVWVGLRGLEARAFRSYRGNYYQLAILVTTDGNEGMDEKEFLAALKAQIGAIHEGWKGGYYTMTAATPVWVVTDAGFSGSNAITGVLWNNSEIAIQVETDIDKE